MAIFTESQPQYSVLDLGFDKSLTKIPLSLQGPVSTTPELSHVFSAGVAPKSLIAGELITVLEQQSGVIFSGKTTFSVTEAGYRLGIDTDGIAKFFIGGGTVANSLTWDGTTLLVGGIDLVTKFVFGDGSDGNVTISINTTLIRDMFYNNLTVNSGIILSPAGYKIFVKGTLTNNGTISRPGNAGSVGEASIASQTVSRAGGAGGAALVSGSVYGADAGKTGGAGSWDVGSNGINGANLTDVLGSSGVAGGVGGNGIGAGGSASSGGTATIVTNVPKNVIEGVIMRNNTSNTFNQFTSAAGSGSGGGGGGNSNGAPPNQRSGGGGGGSGTSGGIIFIAANTLTNNVAGIISANGGAGGNGGIGLGSESTGGGGGGGGGNGGVVFLIYGTKTNNGSIVATGGAGGAFGTGGVANGANGTAGAAGVVIEIAT